MTYLSWLATFFGIPISIFLLFDHGIFIKYRKIFGRIWLGSLLFALPWDILAVTHKAWTFPQGLLGIYIFNLPVEEYLWGAMFSVIVTYFTLYLIDHGK